MPPRSLISLFLLFALCTMGARHAVAQKAVDASSARISVSDPEALIEHEEVSFQETTRYFRKAKFDGLRKRYETIDGIVMVGLTKDGSVLLRGPESWSPPGGAVEPGEDWATAARRVMKEIIGSRITLDAPVLVERMQFRRKDKKDAHFSALVLHFRASLGKADADYIADPGDEETPALKWFDKVPEDAHPNHVDHIRLYLK